MSSRPRATGSPVVRTRLLWRLAAAAVSVLAVLALAALPSTAQEVPGEPSIPELIVPDETTDTTAVLTPEGGGEPAPAGPTTTLAPAVTGASDGGGDGLAASTKVWIIIGALVAVAFVVLVLTILYWRRTRPTGASRRRVTVAADPATAADDDLGWDAEAAAAPPPAPADSTAPPAPAPAPSSGPAEADAPAEAVEPPPVTVGPDEGALDPKRSVFAPPVDAEAPEPPERPADDRS